MQKRKPSSKRRRNCTRIPRIVALVTSVVFLKLISHSWMLMRKVAVNTQSHHDGIIPLEHTHSKASVQRNTTVKYAYVIGQDQFAGRTNNELLAVLRALDRMFDQHGDYNNCTAILVICGWARDMLKGFFFNETKHQDWARRLEQVTPYMITRGRLGSLPGTPSCF